MAAITSRLFLAWLLVEPFEMSNGPAVLRPSADLRNTDTRASTNGSHRADDGTSARTMNRRALPYDFSPCCGYRHRFSRQSIPSGGC